MSNIIVINSPDLINILERSLYHNFNELDYILGHITAINKYIQWHSTYIIFYNVAQQYNCYL